MIETTIANWHKHIRGQFPGGLDELLADDCIFYSPVVFTPQKGKAITKLYLSAAIATFGAGTKGAPQEGPSEDSPFRYIRQAFGTNLAVLEFETEMDGKYINGVDMISCADDGKIVEFKVMLRPLQAVNVVHQRMAAMLKSFGS